MDKSKKYYERICFPKVEENILQREHLINQLIHSKKKVILLEAPIGYGKTNLLASVARLNASCTCWYSLNASDNKPRQLIELLTRAIQSVKPDFVFDYKGEELDSFESITKVAYEFAITLAQSINGRFIIVFDHFQEINHRLIDEILSNIIRYTSENIKVMIATNNGVPHFLAKYVLSENVEILGENRLAFQEKEIRKIVHRYKNEYETYELTKEILKLSKGWPIGVQALLQILRSSEHQINQEDLMSILPKTLLYPYLHYELFDKFDVRMQTFLINTSYTQVISVEQANAILSIENSKERFEELVLQRAFTYPVEHMNGIYEYHPMFREFLQTLMTVEEKKRIQDLKMKDEVFRYQLSKPKITCTQPEFVNVYCFGGLTVKVAQEEVKWRTNKAKELFAYLFHLQGTMARKEVMIESLWPEAVMDTANTLFHTTLSYVRKAFANANIKDIICTVNHAYSLNMKRIKSDCKLFSNIYENIKHNNYIAFLEKENVLGIYRGSYMEGLDYDWCVDQAEYYERVYLKCCEQMAMYDMKSGKFESALYCVKGALKIDPYSEQLISLLLQCYAKLEDYKHVKINYEKAKEMFRKDLNINIGSEVTKVYKECITQI